MSLILAAVLLITLLIVGVIVRMLVKPVRQLAHVMGHYRLGDSLEGLDMTRQDEIGHLNRSFKRLTTNIQELFANGQGVPREGALPLRIPALPA